MQNNKIFSFSNILIVTSIIFTIIGYLNKDFLFEWSLNKLYLKSGNLINFIIQIFTSKFIHGGLMHLLFNSIFIYYFGNIIETIIGKKKFIIFFILTAIFNSIFILYIQPISYTIGISGFALAIITYYTLELKKSNNPEYKGGITAIIVNIAIGFYPGISLYGHIGGVIFGIIFFYITNDFTKKQIIGMFNYNNKQELIKKI